MRSDRPPGPLISIGNMKSVAANPVPQMIVSTSCSVPSSVRTPVGSTAAMRDVSTATLGRCSAGSQCELNRMRLQPKV